MNYYDINNDTKKGIFNFFDESKKSRSVLIALFAFFSLSIAFFASPITEKIDSVILAVIALVVIGIAVVFQIFNYSSVTSKIVFFVIVGFINLISFSFAAVIASVILCITIGSYLILKVRSKLLILIPLVTITLSYFIFCSIIVVSIECFITIAAVILSLCISKDVKRVVTIVIISLILFVVLLSSVCYLVYLENDVLTFEILQNFIDSYKAELITAITDLFNEYMEAYGDLYKNIDSADVSKMITEYVDAGFTLLPGILYVVCLLIAYLANFGLLSFFKKAGMQHYITEQTAVFRLNIVTAWVFLFSYISSVFITNLDSPIYVVVVNLIIVFNVLFFIAGISRLLTIRSKFRNKSKKYIIILIIISVFIPGIAIVCGTTVGLISTFSYNKLQKILNKNNGNKNNDNNDDNDNNNNFEE